MSILLKVVTGLVSLAMLGAVSVTDPTGDAVGDGTIVAPTAPRYANSAIFDLQDVSIEVLQDGSGGSVILLPAETGAAEGGGAGGSGAADAPLSVELGGEVTVELADVRSVVKVTLGAIDVSESTALGFGSVVVDLYLDGAPGGRETTLAGPGMLMPAGRGWEYAVRLTPDGATGFRYVEQAGAAVADEPVAETLEEESADGTELQPPSPQADDFERTPVGVSLNGSTLTVELPWDFTDEVVVYALSGVHDPFNPTGWRPLAVTPSPWAYSGGEQVVPVVDLVAPNQEAQDRALRTGVLPLPTIAVRDRGVLWLLLMALGLSVAAAGLVLRRRVPGQAKRQLRTGLPPEPVAEAPVPASSQAFSAPLAPAIEPAVEPQVDTPGSDAFGNDIPPATTGAETPTISQEDAEPALSGISAFDSYVLSEVLAEDEEHDVEGFDDLTHDQT